MLILGLGFPILGCSGGGGGSDPVTCDLQDIFPFNYTLTDQYLLLDGDSGQVKTTIHPFGTHVLPHTGHAIGKSSSDWNGLYATTYSELTYVSGGDGSAPCNAGDTCGISLTDINNRWPSYIAPIDGFEIYSVELLENDVSTDEHISGSQHWRVQATVCDDTYDYSMGHMANISRTLRDKIVAQGYQDPWTLTETNSDIITGNSITLIEGEEIGKPQVLGTLIDGTDGMYSGPGGGMETPWVEIEYDINAVADDELIHSKYSLFSSDDQVMFQQTINYEGGQAESFIYSPSYLHPWLWRAEMRLHMVETIRFNDVSAITAHLGSWWEYRANGCAADCSNCDNIFVIFPIAKDTIFYDASLYTSADVSYLTFKHIYGDDTLDRFGEVMLSSTLDPTRDQLLIKWRTLGWVGGEDIDYQKMSY